MALGIDQYFFCDEQRSRLPVGLPCRCPRDLLSCGECPKASCGYSVTTPSGREALRNDQNRTDNTHIEDLKDSTEVLFPRGDGAFVFLGMEESREHFPFSVCGDPLLNLRHGAAIETFLGNHSAHTLRVQLTLSVA